MARLNAKNNAFTTLAAQLAQGATSVDVTDGAKLPDAPFRLTILDASGDVAEIVEVGTKSGNTISNLVRGLEGTADQTHNSGVTVEARWTSGMYDRLAYRYLDINSQTGTAYTLVLADDGKLIDMDNAGAITLTVPTNAAVAFEIGTQILVRQKGAGQVTVVGDTGVTVQAANGNNKTAAQHSVAGLIKVATDTWLLFGDITT